MFSFYISSNEFWFIRYLIIIILLRIGLLVSLSYRELFISLLVKREYVCTVVLYIGFEVFSKIHIKVRQRLPYIIICRIVIQMEQK